MAWVAYILDEEKRKQMARTMMVLSWFNFLLFLMLIGFISGLISYIAGRQEVIHNYSMYYSFNACQLAFSIGGLLFFVWMAIVASKCR